MSDCPRIIWMYWHQGFDQAPATVLACVDSWRRLNPDWKLLCLDHDSVAGFIGSGHDWEKLEGLGLEKRANLIRLHLLRDHGGVWADASTVCIKPLDQWVDAALASGFFCFVSPGRDRVMSNWFMAAQPGSVLVCEQLDTLCAYFIENNFGALGPLRRWLVKRLGKYFNRSVTATRSWFSWWVRRGLRIYPYFIFHYLFARLIEENPACRAQWQLMPKISAEGPHDAQRAGLLNPLPQWLHVAIDDCEQPLYKLDWRVNVQKAPEFTVLDYLLHRRAMVGNRGAICE